MDIAISIVALVIVLINIHISIGAIKNSFYERSQKKVHLILIWLVPLLGAFIVWRFVSEVEPSSFPFGLHYKNKKNSTKTNPYKNKNVNDEVIKYESWKD